MNFLDLKKLETSITDTYGSLSRLNQEASFSILNSHYGHEFNEMYFKSICSYQKFKSKKLITCEEEILEKGIETAVIYVLESTRKFQKEYSSIDLPKAKEVVNSEELIQLSKSKKSVFRFFGR